MQMLDSRGDNQGQGGDYNAPMGGQAPMNDNASMGSGYNTPTQREEQSYQQPSFNNNQAQAQSREMPSADAISEIDIDEDEIPF